MIPVQRDQTIEKVDAADGLDYLRVAVAQESFQCSTEGVGFDVGVADVCVGETKGPVALPFVHQLASQFVRNFLRIMAEEPLLLLALILTLLIAITPVHPVHRQCPDSQMFVMDCVPCRIVLRVEVAVGHFVGVMR